MLGSPRHGLSFDSRNEVQILCRSRGKQWAWMMVSPSNGMSFGSIDEGSNSVLVTWRAVWGFRRATRVERPWFSCGRSCSGVVLRTNAALYII
jgi:hypothetical protein